MIPTLEHLNAQLQDDMESVRWTGVDGTYEKLHPWAIKAIIQKVELRVGHIIDYAHRYERMGNE